MKRIFAAALSALLITASLCTSAFAWKSNPVNMDKVEVDVGASDWAVEELAAAGKAGIVPNLNGNPKFSDSITRLQFAQLAVAFSEKALGKEIAPAAMETFSDCKDPAVLKAYAAGIVSGVGDNKFAPDTTTNREQIAAMIYRAITYIEKETGKAFTTKTTDLAKFTDNSDVSSWAMESVGVLASNGIMSGTSATTLSPKNPCTVEQSILLIYRVYQQATAS